jgi:hypothetical protein
MGGMINTYYLCDLERNILKLNFYNDKIIYFSFAEGLVMNPLKEWLQDHCINCYILIVLVDQYSPKHLQNRKETICFTQKNAVIK